MAFRDDTKQKRKLVREHTQRAQASSLEPRGLRPPACPEGLGSVISIHRGCILLTGTSLGSGYIYREQNLVLGDHKLALWMVQGCANVAQPAWYLRQVVPQGQVLVGRSRAAMWPAPADPFPCAGSGPWPCQPRAARRRDGGGRSYAYISEN